MEAGFISREAYLNLASGKAASRVDLEDHTLALTSILGTPENEARLIATAEAFLVDTSQGYEGIVVIVPLAKAKQVLDGSRYKALNWHYDRNAECVLVNLRAGCHERLSATLFGLYSGQDEKMENAAENFIEQGMGWFKSSSSHGRMLKGKNVKMTAQEKTVFKPFL